MHQAIRCHRFDPPDRAVLVEFPKQKFNTQLSHVRKPQTTCSTIMYGTESLLDIWAFQASKNRTFYIGEKWGIEVQIMRMREKQWIWDWTEEILRLRNSSGRIGWMHKVDLTEYIFGWRRIGLYYWDF